MADHRVLFGGMAHLGFSPDVVEWIELIYDTFWQKVYVMILATGIVACVWSLSFRVYGYQTSLKL